VRRDVVDVPFGLKRRKKTFGDGRSDDFFFLSRTSQGEEPLDTGGGRVSLPRCLFWSSGHCQRFGAGNVSRSGLSPFVVFELYDMRDKKKKKKPNTPLCLAWIVCVYLCGIPKRDNRDPLVVDGVRGNVVDVPLGLEK